MRKYIIELFIILILINLTACNNKQIQDDMEESSSISEETNSSTVPIPTTEAKPVETITEVDYGEIFEGINGSAVFYTPSKLEYKIHNMELSEYASSPCSTFKIISSLMGLEHGVIDPSNSVRKWNGTEYWKSDWNNDIDFTEAFKASCVWYYREVTNQLGQTIVQQSLDQLNYGNCDISDWEGRLNTNNNNRDLTGFWIESSLKISPKEQVNVLSSIFENKFSFSEDNLTLLKQVMLVESEDKSKYIYGKTGTGVKEGKCVDAWFVGMFEQFENMTYFAIRLDDPDNKDVSSQKAKKITLDIINKYFLVQ